MHFFKAWGKRNLLSRLGTNLVIQSRLVFLLLHTFFMARYFMQPDTRLSAGCSQENLFVFFCKMQIIEKLQLDLFSTCHMISA
jgi:hypothetical protein